MNVLAASLLCAAAAAQMPPTPVLVDEVRERQTPATIRLVGTVLAARESTIASEIAGIVAELLIVDGQHVQAGGVLCALNDDALRYRLEEARALLARADAELAELVNGTRPEELQRAEATAAEMQAVIDKWEFERRRMEALAQRDQANEKERHDVDMELAAARQRLRQEQARLDLARNGARREQIDAKRADADAQRAVVRRLERDLDKTRIRAPFTGVVVARHAEVGQWVQIGGAICTLVDIETVKVRTDVPEAAVRFASSGAAATIDVEALERTIPATIARVVPKAAARTFPVEIDLPNPRHELLPGMFVWTHVPSGPPGNRLFVPMDAVVARGRDKTVWVVRDTQAGKTAIPLPAVTGLASGDAIEVQAEGLRAGDKVVIRANERLFGPSPVAVLDAPAGSQPATHP